MPTPTHTLIASSVLSSSASSITFSSIPNTYKDLILVGNGTFNDNAICNFYFSGSSRDGARLYASSSLASDNMPNNDYFWSPVSTSRRTFSFVLQIFDYAATNKYKHAICRAHNDTSVGIAGYVGLNTAALTQIDIIQNSIWSFQSGSKFYLYGIAG